MWVRSLSWEDPLQKGKATHSRILAWRIQGLSSPWGHKESDTTERLSLSLHYVFSSVQFSSVTQSCLILCDPMNYSTPGLPIHHQLPEFTQTHVHGVGDVIQPSHPLLSPSPLAFNLSQHQGLFQRVGSHIRWPKHWSFSFSISPTRDYSGLIFL